MRKATLVMVLLAAGCSQKPPAGPPRDPAPADELRKELDRQQKEFQPAALAAHPFWRKKMTADDVEAIVAKIIAQKRSTIVHVDDRGQVVLQLDSKTADPIFVDDAGRTSDRLPELSSRCIDFDLKKEYDTRPTRAAVLLALRAKLNVADYRD